MSRTFPEWAKNVNVYEVNIRQYTEEGTITAFANHLPRLRDMGVDVIWLMPIFPISRTKRKGSLGSYYAVSDFRAVNPEFGTLTDIKKLIDEIHALGMKVILDWVPNHTGWDHIWITEHSDFYTKNDHGQITEPRDNNGHPLGWSDVADLNYDNRNLWQAMLEDMLFWIGKYAVDGFRMDMALLVPLKFWQWLSSQLKSLKPDILLLAESEMKEHLDTGCFDIVYSWKIHHAMTAIAQGLKDVSAIDDWYVHERSAVRYGSFLHFTSNHDENSWSGSEIERLGEAHKAFAVLVNCLDGIPLIYTGQEEPMPHRLKFFDKDLVGFGHYTYAGFYKKLNQLRHQNRALWAGGYGGEMLRILPHKNIYAFERQKDNNKITVVINLSRHRQKVVTDFYIEGTELFTEKHIRYLPGTKIDLAPWEYQVIY